MSCYNLQVRVARILLVLEHKEDYPYSYRHLINNWSNPDYILDADEKSAIEEFLKLKMTTWHNNWNMETILRNPDSYPYLFKKVKQSLIRRWTNPDYILDAKEEDLLKIILDDENNDSKNL